MPRIVLCGSMSAMPVMLTVRDALQQAGIRAVVPPPDVESEELSTDALLERKRSASLAHIRRILDRSTAGILVVNVDKYGRRDYVGPNAFAEIAVAFAHGRRIFLYQGMPEQYSDELTAWGVSCLHGDLSDLVASVVAAQTTFEDTRQLALFR